MKTRTLTTPGVTLLVLALILTATTVIIVWATNSDPPATAGHCPPGMHITYVDDYVRYTDSQGTTREHYAPHATCTRDE